MAHRHNNEAGEIVYRSGAAARLAGLSVETLRVWERRYQLSDARRSAQGQRLYSAAQVARLGMLKQLVDRGHPIGVLAGLSSERLQAMLGAAAPAAKPSALVTVILAGPWLARRVQALGPAALDLVLAGSAHALAQLHTMGTVAADVLVIEHSELLEADVAPIGAAMAACQVAATVVLYRFATSSTIRALRARGCLVARIPADLMELAPLCRAALASPRPELAPLPALETTPALSPRAAPRFDEAALAAILAAGNRIACECPRHLAELLLMAGSFERYSRQCAHRNADDAALHLRLAEASGQARTILEQAMVDLALADGLPLPQEK